MYNILIQKDFTALFYGDLIDNKPNDKDILGLLINQPGIKTVIESLPIEKYFLDKHPLGEIEEITKEQAFFIYKKIERYFSNNIEVVRTDNVFLEKVVDFCNINCEYTNKTPLSTQFNKMAWAMYYEIKEFDEVDNPFDVRVYQTLGLDKFKLAHFQGLGLKTLDNYESMLRKYNLSMTKRLDEEEIVKIKQLRKELMQ